MRALALLLLLSAAAACTDIPGFRCESDEQCGTGGRCEDDHACSFADATCHAGRRYGATWR